MKTTFLDFEQPIAELEAKIEELRFVRDDSAVDISGRNRAVVEESQQLTKDLCRPVAVAGLADRAASAASVRSITLRNCLPIFTSCTATAHSRTTCRSSAASRARFGGHPCMVIGHQKAVTRSAPRASGCRVRKAIAGRAPDASRREVRSADLHVRRHAGRVPGHRRGRARPVGGDRSQPLRDGRAEDADHHDGDRRGGSGGALAIAVADTDDAAILDLLGDLAGRLRVDPVEERREGAGSSGSAGPDRTA